MIVIGVDVHKHSLTAVAVDEVGRPLARAHCAVDDGVARLGAELAGGAVVGARGLPACDPRRSSRRCWLPASGWCGCRRG